MPGSRTDDVEIHGALLCVDVEVVARADGEEGASGRYLSAG